MYNRYMRNDDGSYTRIPEEEPARRPAGSDALRRRTGSSQRPGQFR
jgi:hypothetical protein